MEKGMKEGRMQRKKKGEQGSYTQDTHTSEKRARVKVERNIKKHSAALEIHVIQKTVKEDRPDDFIPWVRHGKQ